MNNNDEKEKVVFDWLNTHDGIVLLLLYFRIKLYQGKFTVSFDDMMYVLKLSDLTTKTGTVYYKAGVTKYKKIDVWLQQKFNSFRDNLTLFRDDEKLVLSKYQEIHITYVNVRLVPKK